MLLPRDPKPLPSNPQCLPCRRWGWKERKCCQKHKEIGRTPVAAVDEGLRVQGHDADHEERPREHGEHRQALEQWLQEIPDNPGELLRRKFWYEQQQHQDKTR